MIDRRVTSTPTHARVRLLAAAVGCVCLVVIGLMPATAAAALGPAGSLAIIAGTGQSGGPTPGPATSSDLDYPYGVAVDSSGNVYIADSGNDVVEKVTPSGTLSILAGTVGQSGASTPGPATSSLLNDPTGVAVDSSGNVYIADTRNDVVEQVTPSGTLSILAGTVGESPAPGVASSSLLQYPSGVAVDTAGNVYIADSLNFVVRKVAPSGTVSTIAGQFGRQGQPTPGPATSSDLNEPMGVAVDSAGDVYIADSSNYVVEQVTPSGTLSIVAGNGFPGVPTPGPATSSGLGGPEGVAVDGSGSVFIADDNAVEKVMPSGSLSIVAGIVGQPGLPTPGPATSSDIDPTGLAIDSSGSLYIADFGNSDVEQVVGGGSGSVAVPAIAGYPSISGQPFAGQPLTESPGTWTQSPTSYTYQWKRCDAAVVCATVSTAPSYTLTPSDLQDSMLVLVTAHNDIGASLPASSGETAVVTDSSPQPPTGLSSPTISGQPIVGQTLAEAVGTWTRHPTSYTYEWKDCTSTGPLVCTTVSRAPRYQVTSADLGFTILVLETAYNAAGASVPESSVATATVTAPGAARPPLSTKVPGITGRAIVGRTLREVHGRWNRHHTRYSYRWYVCRHGGEACTAIAGATHRTYRLSIPVMHDEIRVREIAYNTAGAGEAATSAPTRRIIRPSAQPAH